MARSGEDRRNRMVDRQLVDRGIADPLVLGAMRKVPRHLFVSSVLADCASLGVCWVEGGNSKGESDVWKWHFPDSPSGRAAGLETGARLTFRADSTRDVRLRVPFLRQTDALQESRNDPIRKFG